MAAAAAAPSRVELRQLFRDYLRSHSRIPSSELKLGLVDLSGLLVEHKETKFDGDSAQKQSRPESQITFESELSNSTSSSQTLVLHTEREVTSTYKVTMQQCFTIEGSLTLSLTLPQSVFKLGVGEKHTMQFTGGTETTSVEKKKWSLDTTVVVSSGKRTRVQIKMDEEEYEGRFSVTSRISGSVVFRPRNRDGSWSQHGVYVIDDVRNVLVPASGFEEAVEPSNARAVEFTSYGQMYCRYGVRQEVRMTEYPIGK